MTEVLELGGLKNINWKNRKIFPIVPFEVGFYSFVMQQESGQVRNFMILLGMNICQLTTNAFTNLKDSFDLPGREVSIKLTKVEQDKNIPSQLNLNDTL